MLVKFPYRALPRLSVCVKWVLLWGILLFPSYLFADSTLIFPRLSFDPHLLTGVALVNPGTADAVVTLTAFGADGQPLGGDGIRNPVELTIPAGQQVAKEASELFGSGADPLAAAWILASSNSDGLTGFFLLMNPALTLLDGADPPLPAQKCVFNLIRLDSGYTTELDIINPNDSSVDLQLQLAGAIPVPTVKQISVPGKGILHLDVADFFQTGSVSPGAYVIVDASAAIAGFELVRSPSGEAVGLNARSVSEKLASLFFLEMPVLGPSRSQLGVVNYSADPVVLTITAYRPDGTLYDSANLKYNPVTRALPGGSSLREDVASMFGFAGDQPLDGWLSVKSTSAAINGYLDLSVPSVGAEAAVTSPPQGRTRALFSHIASAAPFYSTVNLLNPSSLSDNVRIVALKPTGEVLGSLDLDLLPGERWSGTLGTPGFIPGAAGQDGGFIWVHSQLPTYMDLILGDGQALAAIPAQDAPEGYSPDAALPAPKLNPVMAVVPPGGSQRFVFAGVSGTPEWLIDGVSGASGEFGSVNSNGVFTAPNKIPSPQVVTVTAQAGTASAGASADVIDKAVLVSGLKVVQSVTYLANLKRAYAAELIALSQPGLHAADAAVAAGNSQIVEASPGAPEKIIAGFTNENIVKIISFTASDNVEYLLLLAQTTGRILRVNPLTQEIKEMAAGLTEPTSMVFDQTSGDLLVVESDRITTVPRDSLQPGLPGSAVTPAARASYAPASEQRRSVSSTLEVSGIGGVAVDSCSGKIYYSLPATGEIVAYSPNGTSLTVATGLANPGQLLGVYRTRLGCPDSFHLLVAEQNADRVDLIVPSQNVVTRWVDAPGIRDLAFVPSGNPFSPQEGVLLADYTLELNGIIYLVPLEDLYDEESPNPPVHLDRTADTALAQSCSPSEGYAGAEIACAITVRNNGPLAATGLSFLDTLPDGASLVYASASGGTCSQAGTSVLCSLSSLDPGANNVVRVVFTIADSASAGQYINKADLTSAEVDPNPVDNVSSAVITVLDLPAAKFAIPGQDGLVVAGRPFDLTLSAVSNAGTIVPAYSGTVHFTSSDPRATLPPDYTFVAGDNGSHDFSNAFILRTAGSQSITVQGTTPQAAAAGQKRGVVPAAAAIRQPRDAASPGAVTGQLAVMVSAAAPASLQAAGIGGAVTAGVFQSPVLTVLDAYGNVVTEFSGQIHFYSTDPLAVLPPDYAMSPSDRGSHVFTNALTLRTPGSQQVTIQVSSPDSLPTLTVSLQVENAQQTPTISWSNPGDIVYGTALGHDQLNATASVPGAFVYTPAAGTVLGAGGSQILRVDFTPNDTANYLPAVKTVQINVVKSTPAIAWPDPLADITYGTPLGSQQLNASSSVPGTFVYTPAAGTVLGAGGSQTLRVDFTPNDTANYLPAVKTVRISVVKATPAITWPDHLADLTYGTPLGSQQLNAASPVQGTFVYTPPAGTVLAAGGARVLRADFLPTDSSNYSAASKSTLINVLRAAPSITWANPGDISYGTTLGASQLNASTSVPGSLTYTPAAGTILPAGVGQVLRVDFTPDDTTDYLPASMTVQINVLKTAAVIAWNNPADILYGMPLGPSQLNANASVPGSFMYTPAAGTLLPAGAGQALKVVFVPSDVANYAPTSKTVLINVLRAVPVINWSTPADIVYGTPLGPSQLSASASVPGSFMYTPAPGTVLPAGTGQYLRVEFMPSDAANYAPASKSVLINVLKAVPVITWNNPADIALGTKLSTVQLNAVASVPGTFVYTPPAGTQPPLGKAQTLRVDFTPSDLQNYSVVSKTVVINVIPCPDDDNDDGDDGDDRGGGDSPEIC